VKKGERGVGSEYMLMISIGVDFVQEKFMGAGPQDNESAVEQAKDEQISDFIRGQYKSKFSSFPYPTPCSSSSSSSHRSREAPGFD
jgi:hypothetical protein